MRDEIERHANDDAGCAAFKENVAAFVLGALDPDEHRGCEQHLAAPVRHDGCPEALERHQKVNRHLLTMRPPSFTWTATQRAFQIVHDRRVRNRRAQATLGALAAAACVLLVVVGVSRRRLVGDVAALAGEVRRGAETQTQTDAARVRCLADLQAIQGDVERFRLALALVAEPAARVSSLRAPAGSRYTATSVSSARRGEAVILSNTLTPVPGKEYALWVAAAGGAPTLVGHVPVSRSAAGLAVARLGPDALSGRRPHAVMVTLETGTAIPTKPGEIVLDGVLGL